MHFGIPHFLTPDSSPAPFGAKKIGAEGTTATVATWALILIEVIGLIVAILKFLGIQKQIQAQLTLQEDAAAQNDELIAAWEEIAQAMYDNEEMAGYFAAQASGGDPDEIPAFNDPLAIAAMAFGAVLILE
jgi:hypothetical protein